MNWKNIGKGAIEALRAMFKGEFLLRIGADKYFIHILYAFMLMMITIWVSYTVDNTLMEVEKNKKILGDERIYHAEMTGRLVELNRISTVQENLQRLGSDLRVAEKPATKIVK